ncbi:TetR family transcriptional regulator [Streptomyces cinereoruber]
MASQERAERTRRRLLEAAAEELSQHGFDGTSLQRVCRTAGVTMGALTFHFSNKMSLADAVHAHGHALTRTMVTAVVTAGEGRDGDRGGDGTEGFTGKDTPRLRQVVGVTDGLTRLLREEPTVRAAARLSRDRTLKDGHWNDSWLPRVHELLELAHEEGELRSGVNPHSVALLARLLISGLAASTDPDGDGETFDQLDAIWGLVLSGITGDDRGKPD